MNNKYEELSNKYKNFYYDGYSIDYLDDSLKIKYCFKIEDLCTFTPELTINTKLTRKNKSFIENLVFNIGMIELISYWKSTCSKNIIINCGYLSNNQIEFFKKIYFNGLGEFFYRNNINVDINNFVNIISNGTEKYETDNFFKGEGNLIPIGGGKDSNVTLELLKEYNNTSFVINPKQVHLDCIKLSNIKDNIFVNRTIDKKLLELNDQGFLNGHTPFSSLVSFISLLCAYLNDKKYIVLSNEGSANESTVIGTNINHQYSKSYEYEQDFNDYVNKYFNIDIRYFSILRCLNELQIMKLFSKYEKYHKVFKSCNLGSKNNEWSWCLKCGKCLFTFIMMSAFLDYEYVIDIFGTDMLNDVEMLEVLKELLGEKDSKPFECVGTINEVKTALSMIIKKNNNRSNLLLDYYKNNYELIDNKILNEFNNENNIEEEFINIIKKELD